MEQQRDQQAAAAAARAAAELRRHAAATLALLEGAAASTTSRGREQWRELLERQDPRGTLRLRREVLAAQRRARQPARSSDDAVVRRFHPE
eukprot:COSAG01_NODE_258_length_20077_cov_124.162429_22_plen_91_part_00